MAKVRWAVRCSAHRTNGLPCSAWAITGGRVCVKHGGAAPQVKAAAARQLLWDREIARQERDLERRRGRPLTPIELVVIRYLFSADPATWRRHRRTRPLDDAVTRLPALTPG